MGNSLVRAARLARVQAPVSNPRKGVRGEIAANRAARKPEKPFRLDGFEDLAMSGPMPLIRCGDGGLVPCVLTCRHVLDGTATSVVPLPRESGDEVQNDWFCPQCLEKYFGENAAANLQTLEKDLRLFCIHCFRKVFGNLLTPQSGS